MSVDWSRRQNRIGRHHHLPSQIINPNDASDAELIDAQALAVALAALDITPEIVQNFFNETSVTEIVNQITEITENNEYITQITENNTFIEQITQLITELTEITENNTYVTALTTFLTELTEITENNTYVTNVVQHITAQINGKKGIANELATLGADAELTPSQVPANLLPVAVPFVIGDGVSVITTGHKGHVEIPFAGTITAWRLLADASGSIVVDTWKDTYANYPPTIADAIWGGSKPTLSSAAKAEATGLSIAVAAGDILAFNVDSASTVKQVTLSLTLSRTR